jgi:pilus assembly protein CpaC
MGRLAVVAAVGLSVLMSAAGYAAGTGDAEGRPAVRAALKGAAVVPPSGPPVVLQLHQGTLIRPPAPVSTVFVADSDIADVTIKTPTLIYVTAKKIGETVIYAVDANDHVLVNTRVDVEYDLPQLMQTYQRLLPGELIEAHSVGQDLVLTGTVSTAAAARKAVQIAAQMFGLTDPAVSAVVATGTSTATAAPGGAAAGASGTPAAIVPRVISELAIATPNQINLHVRIAAVSSTALKELGITLSKSTGKFTFSTTNPTAATTPAQNMFALIQPIGSGQSLNATLDALTTEGLATTLAEPNLTAISGEKASFGVVQTIQIPGTTTAVTTVTTSSTTTVPTTSTSTEPLSAGVTLDFIATILDANHINLKLRPEVSTFDFTTTTTVAGTVIPTTDQTVAQTTVDLGSGQSFALAGLLQRNINQSVSKVPGLGDVPYVGALFRTTSYNLTETELVIVVTPYIVKPMATAAQTPVDGFQSPHDLSRVLLGSKYRQTLPVSPTGPVGPSGEGLVGPAGFRLD